MTQLRACGCWLVCALALCPPLHAQDPGRIWARVHTTSGEIHEGFIRWDRNEGSWVDILDGSKAVPPENYLAWLAGTEREPAVRTIELPGYRISWDEEDPDFPSRSASGIRFGHLASLEVTGRDRARVTLRSGETLELSGGSTDIGRSIRDVVVDVPGGRQVALDWDDVERLVFSPTPADAVPRSRRIYGTVHDVDGGRFTGWISWDRDEILESDVLDGDEIGSRRDREIPFADIAAIERIAAGARVTLRNGSRLELRGSNDVDDGNRGIQISDPRLGTVVVEWEEFLGLYLAEAPDPVGYDAFDGGRPLLGTLVTRSGEEIRGLIRWDADEGASWELLNGRTEVAAFAIELSQVARIERGEAFGAIVTLVDGRSFALDHSNDVDWDNKGILVAPEDADPAVASSWRLVSWEDFREVRFGLDAAAGEREPGR